MAHWHSSILWRNSLKFLLSDLRNWWHHTDKHYFKWLLISVCSFSNDAVKYVVFCSATFVFAYNELLCGSLICHSHERTYTFHDGRGKKHPLMQTNTNWKNSLKVSESQTNPSLYKQDNKHTYVPCGGEQKEWTSVFVLVGRRAGNCLHVECTDWPKWTETVWKRVKTTHAASLLLCTKKKHLLQVLSFFLTSCGIDISFHAFSLFSCKR